jgi:hypothetical protein
MTRITWDDGGDATLGPVHDLAVTLLASSRAYPPGAPVRGTLHGDTPLAFTLKVAGSKREGEGYTVRGKLVSATAAVRDAFQALAPSGA